MSVSRATSGGLIGSSFSRSMMLCCAALVACAPLPSVHAQEAAARVAVEGAQDQWHVESAERAGDARFAEFLGRRSLWLRNSTHVVRTGVEFVDGTIEFDVAPMDRGNFVGVLFRREGFPNQDNIYLRFHRSGLYNALQYAPRVQGSSTWQLYPEFNAVAEWPRNSWTRVRVEVKGARLEVYLNDGGKPALVVPRLRGPAGKGTVAFWGRVNEQPALWSAALSNISIRPASAAADTAEAARPAPPAGTLTRWEVAGPLQAERGAVVKLPPLKDWRAAEAEESGLVNLNRHAKAARGRWTVFARTTIKAAEARTALLELGYSDDVTVFLNGEPVYFGVNGFESRHPEYMGFVKPEFENVSLKLRADDNEITLAVTDDQRFGWGFVARLKD